jgi:hypothetical protein
MSVTHFVLCLRPNRWIRCSAHVIDLCLEDIGKLEWAADTVQIAKELVNWLRSHGWVLALVRVEAHGSDGSGKELIRPGDGLGSGQWATALAFCPWGAMLSLVCNGQLGTGAASA